MASESSEKLEQTARTARRTETPPRSIFDDYHSAYQSILSSGRSLTGNSKAENAPDVRSGPSGLQLPTNPFANLPPLDHNSRNSSYSGQPGSVADVKDNRTSQRPRSPKARPRTNFSRPMSLSPSSGQVTRPAHAVVRNSVSIFDLGSPRTLSEKRSPNTKQPNLYGARGRVDKSSTIGSIVKKYGDEPKSNRRSTDSDHQVEVRSSLDILGCGRGTTELPSVQVRSSPAGQAPNIPLPPDPSYVAARGLAGEILSEASLYENTEKLLNLTQTSGGDALVRSASSDQIPHHLEDRLHSEFSWMGNRGMSSFRDLSVKELRQLPKSTHASARDVASKDVEDTPGGDESYDDQYLLTDAVYQPPVAVQRSDTLDNTAKENARRAEMLLDNLVTDLFEEAVEGSATDEVDVDTVEARGPVSGDARTDAGLDHGGLQSSSSRGASLEASLRDGPFRPGLYMDESSLVSLVGRESADAARRSAIAKGKMVVRSTEDNDEDGVHTVAGADENEGGEWETLGESGMRSKLGTQASIRRDTSGSSLANVSSIESTQNDRAAPSPWDPLRSHPVIVTPPNKAVVHPRRGGVSKVQEPATVPRYAAPGADQRISGALNTTSSSTPALTFPATPHNQKGRQNSPPYRHPTPLSHQHQNPFISSPPSVEAQAPGASYELTEFTDRGNEKRRAIYADSPRSLFQQIRKPTTPKSESRVNNPFTTQDTRSETSVDGSYSTTYPTNLAVDGSSILNPDSSRTPKSANSYTRGSIKRTKQYFTGSPRFKMSESRRYQRIREEMGCGTGGIVRVPGMQQTAPPDADIPEELIGPTKPYRAANPFPDLPQRNSFEMTVNEHLSHSSTNDQIAHRMIMANNDMEILKKTCPTFPVNEQMLQTFFRNIDGTVSTRPKAKRGTVREKDGSIFEQAYCDEHHRWEFSHTPYLTKRVPKEDEKLQRKAGKQLVALLFVSVVGWMFLVGMVAWDPVNGRNDLIREWSKGRVHSFHEKEIATARMLTGVMVAVVAVALTMVGVYVE